MRWSIWTDFKIFLQYRWEKVVFQNRMRDDFTLNKKHYYNHILSSNTSPRQTTRWELVWETGTHSTYGDWGAALRLGGSDLLMGRLPKYVSTKEMKDKVRHTLYLHVCDIMRTIRMKVALHSETLTEEQKQNKANKISKTGMQS